MAEVKKVKVVFQFRRATTEQWSRNEDEIPYAGEPCFDLTLGTLRIGDGNTAYRDLKVIGSASMSDDDLSLIIDDVSELKELVGELPVKKQIEDAISNLQYDINEDELQSMLNSVLIN